MRGEMSSSRASTAAAPRRSSEAAPGRRRPLRLGFLGLGWIGLNRLRALGTGPAVAIAAVADPCRQALAAARQAAPDARCASGLDELLDQDLDGVVIATPSAQHAAQACAALDRGLAVFCQKPLARTAAETREVVGEARRRDRLLGVDYCYRYLSGMSTVRRMIQGGELGRLFAVDLTFHNAYGPDKAWFYDAGQSGGGCVMDLGTHLVDLALWVCGHPAVSGLSSRLYCRGELLDKPGEDVEDAAFAQWQFDGVHVRLACSWKLSAGKDAEIGAAFYGTGGALVLRNVDGSFYDFAVEHNRGTRCETLASPPDDWGGRALQNWTARLAGDAGFDPDAQHYVHVAELLDGIYRR